MRATQDHLQQKLEAAVGFHLGYGRGADQGETAWTALQAAAIQENVRSGKRMFYQSGYDWSFLHPAATLTLPEGEYVLLLPEDFGGVEGDVLVSADGDAGFAPVPVTGDARYRRTRNPDHTGRPQVATVEFRKPEPGKHQRKELHFFPTPDQDYEVTLHYYVAKDYEVESAPYLYGGAEHFETLLAACKAAAERDGDDLPDGPQNAYYQQRLQVSMELDRRSKPQHLGYNGDPGSRRYWQRRRNPLGSNYVTFAGESTV